MAAQPLSEPIVPRMGEKEGLRRYTKEEVEEVAAAVELVVAQVEPGVMEAAEVEEERQTPKLILPKNLAELEVTVARTVAEVEVVDQHLHLVMPLADLVRMELAEKVVIYQAFPEHPELPVLIPLLPQTNLLAPEPLVLEELETPMAVTLMAEVEVEAGDTAEQVETAESLLVVQTMDCTAVEAVEEEGTEVKVETVELEIIQQVLTDTAEAEEEAGDTVEMAEKAADIILKVIEGQATAQVEPGVTAVVAGGIVHTHKLTWIRQGGTGVLYFSIHYPCLFSN